jgi:hypothetical protein
MSSPKLTSRNVVPAKRPVVDAGPAPSRAPARPTQPITDAQRNVLLKDMRDAPAPRPAPVDDDLEMEIEVGSEEAAAPAKKATATNAHVAPRRK